MKMKSEPYSSQSNLCCLNEKMMMGIWGILLFCYQTHLASAVVVRLVQLEQLLTLEHVHDLNLAFHVSPGDHHGHQDGEGGSGGDSDADVDLVVSMKRWRWR